MSNKRCSSSLSATPLRPLVIFGSGGHAISVANVAIAAGYVIKNFIDKNNKGLTLFGQNVIGDLKEIENTNDLSFAIAYGDNADRERAHSDTISETTHLYFPSLVHPSAVVALFSEIGEGTVVMPQAVVGPNSRVGKFCLINTRASIDHDCSMLDYSSLGPAAVTGGKVTIGLRSAVSIGAVIKHGLKIGDDCVVGAHSYLNKDLPNNQVAYGAPAKQIRSRNMHDSYLK